MAQVIAKYGLARANCLCLLRFALELDAPTHLTAHDHQQGHQGDREGGVALGHLHELGQERGAGDEGGGARDEGCEAASSSSIVSRASRSGGIALCCRKVTVSASVKRNSWVRISVAWPRARSVVSGSGGSLREANTRCSTRAG